MGRHGKETVGPQAPIFYSITMDIRTKMVLAVVAVALGSMIALGGFMYWFTSRHLKESRLDQLEGLAESVKEGLHVARKSLLAAHKI